jgi:glycosyltransferase involved in cell wall biosynthesis
MIVLYNTNKYLGGGETLLVRFAEHLEDVGADFIVVCARGSYIERSIKKNVECVALDSDTNHYYLSKFGKHRLLGELGDALSAFEQVRFVTFCMRDLHTAFALSQKRLGVFLSHLVLHIQDDLYVGQTLADKLKYKFTGARKFNHRNNIGFNRYLLKNINDNNGLICMAEVISKCWAGEFGIEIPRERIVPLPSFTEKTQTFYRRENDRSIIWIGRLVDFKIPAVVAMVRFLSHNQDYSLTIVGSGDCDRIQKAMAVHGVDPSRIRFIGELGYDSIGAEIEKHAIGYAMGTSLVELAMYKIPVVVALASYDHREYNEPICGGLFYDQPLGCDGSELALGPEATNVTTLQKAFAAIEADYEGTAVNCYTYAKDNFSAGINFQRYLEIINSTRGSSSPNVDMPYPVCTPVRRLLFKALAPE